MQLQLSTLNSFDAGKEEDAPINQPINQAALKTYLNSKVNKSERNSPRGMYLSSLAQKKRMLGNNSLNQPVREVK